MTKQVLIFGTAVMTTLLALVVLWQFRIVIVYVLVSLALAATVRPIMKDWSRRCLAMRLILILILINDHYPENFSLGLLTSSGNLGMLFPPSLPIIVYGLISEVSVDKLFLAGLLPGMLMILLLSLYSVYKVKDQKLPTTPFNLKNALIATKEAAWELPLPLIILVGIYGGFFTPTEAAAVTAFYVLIVEVFIYRDIKITTDLPRVSAKAWCWWAASWSFWGRHWGWPII